MDVSSILQDSLVLLQLICVIVVVAYLVTRSRYFAEVLEGHPERWGLLILTLVFGLLSVYGTAAGFTIQGAVINVRDLGPMMAGLTCGPLVGLGAGLIGAAYRWSLGGFTVVPCCIATILAGIFGGTIYLLSGRKFVGIWIAGGFAVLMEAFHMLLVLALAKPFPAAYELVSEVAIPMNLANTVGVLIFSVIVVSRIEERKTQAERDDALREIERKRTELSIAAEIQQSFLPESLPSIPGLDLAARCLMAREVGGDFYDFIPLGGGPEKDPRVGILIADVSGKGMPAAIFMALSRVILRANALWHAAPSKALENANGTIASSSRSGMFVTTFYGVMDTAGGMLTYVNAGHNPPLLLPAGKDGFRELESTGIALGAMEDSLYTEGKISISPRDLLLLYTDGVTEAVSPAGGMFGEERLRGLVRDARDLPAGAILDRLLQEIQAFTHGEPPADDITLVVLKGVPRDGG
jgi:sigma-B regulation protein RsbU (phosphoserine phosphatase)